MAELVTTSDADMLKAAERVREGRLVSFPTETVYGLGANALMDSAAKRVFEVKGRPATDPLIVHIPSVDVDVMKRLWDVEENVLNLALALGKRHWPGPLTLVAKASSEVPVSVTGGSGFVGLRVPRHEIARKLLELAGCPIAAPSANTFGHVSPTTGAHVMADLASRDDTLTVINGGSCDVGIESTVVKMVSATNLEVLRRGQVGPDDLRKSLDEAGFPSVVISVRDTRAKYKTEDVAMDGPGQLLTHYSPRLPAYLLSADCISADLVANPKAAWKVVLPDGATVPASKVVVIDYANLLGGKIDVAQCRASRSLSTSGDEEEACRQVFDALRWSEEVENAECLVFPLIAGWDTSREGVGQLTEAVEDRLFRAASGRTAKIVPL